MKQSGVQILLVIFVGLVVASFVFDRTRDSNNQIPVVVTALPEIFPGIRVNDITRMELEAVKVKRKFIFERQPGDWKVTVQDGTQGSRVVEAPIAEITQMMQVLATLRYTRVMESMDVKAFGLENGGFFTVKFTAGQAYTLYIGEFNSAQTGIFVQKDNDARVLLVARDPILKLVQLFGEPTDAPPQ